MRLQLAREDSRLLIGGEFHEFHELFLELSWAHSESEFERLYPTEFSDVWVEGI